jgi:transcriptional regulator PpsR
VKSFSAPKKSIGSLDAEVAATVIAAAADVALVIDRKGIVRDFAFGSAETEAAMEGAERWVGLSWGAIVTSESRPKVEALLQDAAAGAPARWRHLNHPTLQGPDIPVLYAAVPLGRDNAVLAVGRGLGAMAALQQRLVEAQQSMERDYSRLRSVELRYRLLFQQASEPVLILDASTQKVVEANPAAAQQLDSVGQIVGRPFPNGFDTEGMQAVDSHFAAIRLTGWAEAVRARLADGGREFLVSASLFRQDNTSMFLVRLMSTQNEPQAAPIPKARSKLLRVVESSPDAFVVTDPEGHVIVANSAFLEMSQLGAEEQARGESLERWLGRPGVDINVLIANLRQHGTVRLFPTLLRGDYGSVTAVEVCAVSMPNAEPACLGFTIRNVDRRLGVEPREISTRTHTVEQLTELVGRSSLKDIVREATDVIERMCIEAALELTNDNRASAAELLGLSRQSLYVKLHRYGLGELTAENEK